MEGVLSKSLRFRQQEVMAGNETEGGARVVQGTSDCQIRFLLLFLCAKVCFCFLWRVLQKEMSRLPDIFICI